MDKHMHGDVRIYIYLRNGTWTYGDTRRVLQAAQDMPSLRGIKGEHRGFNLPPTPDVDPYFLEKIGTLPDGTADIRTYGWSMNDKDGATDDELVKGRGDGYGLTQMMFFPGGRSAIKTLVLSPKYCPTLQQLVDLAKVFETLGHWVVGSRGFDYFRGDGKLCKDHVSMKRFITLRQARDACIQICKFDDRGGWSVDGVSFV